MARHRFAPSLGQRYVRHRPAMPPDVCFISEVIAPNSLVETEKFVLSVELATERLVYTRPELAAHILSGYLAPPGEQVLEQYRSTSLVELLSKSTEKQRMRFKTRAAYVFELELADVGQSWKSPDFRKHVAETFRRRVASCHQDSSAGGLTSLPIESKPPSPHSVYRWVRAYRASACDLRSLAVETLVQRKRKPRRGPEVQLLDAFLAHRRASTGKSTVAQLTIDFNEHIGQLDPRNIDREIERLYQEAAKVAKANATLRKKSGVKRTSKRDLRKADHDDGIKGESDQVFDESA